MPHSSQPTSRVQRMADGLIHARLQGQRFTPPDHCLDLSTEEAYAVQALVADGLGWFPQGVPAWKAGGAPLVSAAPLPGLLASPALWQPVNAPGVDEWIIEAEVAFRLARAPEGSVTGSVTGSDPGRETGPDELIAAMRTAVSTVAVAIEAIDTRLGSGLAGSPSAWKLADQGVHGTLVIGAEQAATPWLSWAPKAWGQLRWQIDVNGRLAQQGQGGLPAVEPLGALRWLAVHAAQHTGGLKAGDVVTTGAWGVVRARRGDVIDVRFDGLGGARLTLA